MSCQVSSQRSQLNRYVSFLAYFYNNHSYRLKRSRYVRYPNLVYTVNSSGDSPAVTWASEDITTTVLSKILLHHICPVPARSDVDYRQHSKTIQTIFINSDDFSSRLFSSSVSDYCANSEMFVIVMRISLHKNAVVRCREL